MQTTTLETSYTGSESAELLAEILQSGAAVRIQVTGSSMRPIIRSGDLVLIRKVSAPNLHRGDIVWFINTDGKYMAHRILHKQVRAGKVYFHTKGDAQVEYDPWTPADKIVGKIYAVEKGRPNRPSRILHLETSGWQLANLLIAFFQIGLSKVILAGRSRLG